MAHIVCNDTNLCKLSSRDFVEIVEGCFDNVPLSEISAICSTLSLLDSPFRLLHKYTPFLHTSGFTSFLGYNQTSEVR